MREHGRLGIAEIENLTRANRNTLKVRLRELVEEKFIKQNGQARATFYTLKIFPDRHDDEEQIKTERLKNLEELTKQAQELDLGY